MKSVELKLINLLKDLKDNYHAIGIKTEFETECAGHKETMLLKNTAVKAGLDLTVKIGGCAAVRDLLEVQSIGAAAVTAPMIESPYAVKKFFEAVKSVFSDKEINIMKFFINIETIYGFKYIDDILSAGYADNISGIVFGRTDMTGSLGMSRNDINSEKILEYAKILAEKALENKKEFITGGGVSAASLPFFKKLPENSLTKFETRKVIFDAQKALNDKNIQTGILKALQFELEWIKYKQNIYNKISQTDKERIKILKFRIS